MAQTAGKKVSRFFIWIIMGLLVVGLMGFGASGLSGTVRSIGSVGDKPIPAQLYFTSLQQQLQGFQQRTGRALTFPEADALGIPQMALGLIVSQRALDAEASRLGLSVGDDRVREQVLQIPAFRGLTGGFDRAAYRSALSQTGQTEQEFETGIREDAARNLLQAAIVSGVDMPDVYGDTLISFIGEERSFTWARMDRSDLITGVPVPTEAQLQSFYEANPEAFTLPQTKRITYAWLTPDMILDQVEIEETALRDLYQERIDEYVQPERRLVERLIFNSTETAEAALTRIASGDTDFDTLVTDRGLTLADVDLGDVLETDLGDAGSAVFSAEPPAVVGPFPTSLGPAIFRLNAILAARETPFEEVRDLLQNELALDRAGRIIDNQVTDLEDLLAAGATVEEVAQDSDLQLAQLDWHPGVEDGIAAYADFRNAAQRAQTSDFPEINGLEDGGIFAMRLDEVIAPRVQPLEEVREGVVFGFEQEQVVLRLADLAERLKPQLEDGTDMATLGLTARAEDAVTRAGFLADTPPDFLETVFEMEPGAVEVVQDASGVIVVRLEAVSEADPNSPENLALRERLAQQAEQSVASDVFEAYARAIQLQAGLSLNQAAINSIHANFQ